jgi:hypothetical protein
MKRFLLAVIAVTTMFSSINIRAQDKENWYDKIKFSGDFQNRFEYISDDTVKNGTDVVKRYRERLRLRVGATADIAQDLKVGFRFNSGEGTNPISAYQTMTTGYSKKGLVLDLAYAEYKPSKDSGIFGLNAVVGKMNTPFYRPGASDLLWDPDLTPEGVFASYSHDFGDKFILKGLFGGFWIEERAKAADAGMLAAEVIGSFKATEKLKFDLGISYYNYGNAKDNLPFYDTTKGFGNTTTTAVAPATAISYKGDYDLLNIGLEACYEFDFAPVNFFVDFVKNSGAETIYDTGFLFGFSIGKIKGPKSWKVSFVYRKLEADAVVGAFSDSENAGGGTNIKGSKISVEYAIYKNVVTGLNVFIGNKNIETTSDKYTKVQVDMSFKF